MLLRLYEYFLADFYHRFLYFYLEKPTINFLFFYKNYPFLLRQWYENKIYEEAARRGLGAKL